MARRFPRDVRNLKINHLRWTGGPDGGLAPYWWVGEQYGISWCRVQQIVASHARRDRKNLQIATKAVQRLARHANWLNGCG